MPLHGPAPHGPGPRAFLSRLRGGRAERSRRARTRGAAAAPAISRRAPRRRGVRALPREPAPGRESIPKHASLRARLRAGCPTATGMRQSWLLLGCLTLTHGDDAAPKITASVHAPAVVEAAEFVVDELSKLSDSGVYETLTLAQIVSAQTQRGVFHENTFLTLELASPHFLSRNATETFEVIDMVRSDDKSRSFAIDTFPEMSEEAIEEFSIRNVERRRALREQAFEELELDACAAGLCDETDDAASYLEKSSSNLLEELKDSAQYPDRRRRAQDALERRAKEDRLRHLVDLHARSSYELDQIASNENDFAVRRALAKQLLDERLALEDKKG